jgi:hypothetical protein
MDINEFDLLVSTVYVRDVQQSEDVSIFGDLSGSNHNPKTLTLPSELMHVPFRHVHLKP